MSARHPWLMRSLRKTVKGSIGMQRTWTFARPA